MTELFEADGKRWGFVAAVLSALPQQARVTAQRIRDWVRRGRLTAHHIGKRLVVALEDVIAIEKEMRQSTKRRGGIRRGTPRPVRT